MNEIKYINDDCFNVFPTLEDNSVDLIVVDSPYGIDFKGENIPAGDWDKFTQDEFYKFNKQWMSEAFRVLKDNGTMWMFCGPTKIPELFKVIDDVGFKNHLENWSIYCRPKGRGSKNKMKSQREDILHLTKSDTWQWNAVEYLREVVVPYVKNGKPRGWALDQTTGQRVRWSGVGNVSFFTPPFYKNVFEPQIHSCQKPVLLNAQLIMLSSKKGDTVLDCFMGSGASGIAAKLTDRNYIGIERDEEMFEKACKWRDNFDDPFSRVSQEAGKYLKKRISSAEKGFKFGFDVREILPK